MTEAPDQETKAPARRNFYGRTHGKTLRASQKEYLAQDLGPLTLKGVSEAENPARAPLDLAFAGGRPLWLEVGFAGASIWCIWPRGTRRCISSGPSPS